MNQLTQLWNRLTWGQRLGIFIAVAGVIGGLLELNHWNQERDFKPLFSGLAAEDAGTVTAKLKELGVDYRLNDADTISIPSDRIAEVRLQLAAAGLPKSGRIGFELFDKVNFGASEFAEQVNYHRAVEGELERSVMSIREVEQARVHLTFAKDSLYTEQREPAKASVLVKLRATAGLSPQNVAAICQLTASAVPGLSPDQVSVVDTSGNLLNRPRPAGSAESDQATEATLDYRKSVERDLQTKIGQTLEPLLGANHFRVGVSADVDLSSGDQSEETYDPQKSVMVSSQTTQEGPGSNASASGVPGTASNLPNPVSAPAPAASNYGRHSENITYQTSRVVKHTKLPQGVLKRLSLSVLVDHSLRWDGPKRVVEPPSAEELKVIHDLVAAAAGLNADRGDQLVVEAFPFEATLTAEPVSLEAPAAPVVVSPLPPWLQKLMAQKSFAMIAAIGGGVALALLVGFVMLLKRAGKKSRITAEAVTAELESGPPREHNSAADAERRLQAHMDEQAAEKAKQELDTLMKLKLPDVSTKKTEVLVKHISAETKKDPTAMAQVVRSWLHGDSVQR